MSTVSDLFEDDTVLTIAEIEKRYPEYYAKDFFVKGEYNYSFSHNFITPQVMIQVLSGKSFSIETKYDPSSLSSYITS